MPRGTGERLLRDLSAMIPRYEFMKERARQGSDDRRGVRFAEIAQAQDCLEYA